MVEAYILFKVSSGTEREVCKQIADFDEVLKAGIIYGEYDVIAKISVPDMKALEEFLSVKLRKVPSVLLTSTMIIAREYEGKTRRNKRKP
jgi:anthranilate phosphoribosyltransferase